MPNRSEWITSRINECCPVPIGMEPARWEQEKINAVPNPCSMGMLIVTNSGKIECTCHLPFQGGSKTTCVNGKVPPTKKFTRVTKTSVSGGKSFH